MGLILFLLVFSMFMLIINKKKVKIIIEGSVLVCWLLVKVMYLFNIVNFEFLFVVYDWLVLVFWFF